MSGLDDFRPTLARQAEAEAAFHQGPSGPRMELWSRADWVLLDFRPPGQARALSRTQRPRGF